MATFFYPYIGPNGTSEIIEYSFKSIGFEIKLSIYQRLMEYPTAINKTNEDPVKSPISKKLLKPVRTLFSGT